MCVGRCASFCDTRRCMYVTSPRLSAHCGMLADDVFRATAMTQQEKEIVAFPLAPQMSQRASAKRKEMFQDALRKAVPQRPQVPHPQDDQATDSAASSIQVAQTTSAAIPGPAASPTFDSLSGSEVYSRWIQMLQKLDIYENQIVHIERRAPRVARYREISELNLPSRVNTALAKCNIRQLYSHQFDAVDAIRNGKNVVLSTSTASGKSLAYNIPMLASMLEAEDSTFLYLFPTKVSCRNAVFAGNRRRSRSG